MSKKATKLVGKLVNSTSGIQVTLEIAKATNKQKEAIEFIRIKTDKKPSQTVINAIKLHGGSWYSVDKCWSIFNSVKNQKFVNKMILKDAFKIVEEEKEVVVNNKPKSKEKGAAQGKTNSIENRVNALEKSVKETNTMLKQILAKLG